MFRCNYYKINAFLFLSPLSSLVNLLKILSADILTVLDFPNLFVPSTLIWYVVFIVSVKEKRHYC